LVLGEDTSVSLNSFGIHGNTHARPSNNHGLSTGSKGTAMQKPGDNAKAFGSGGQVMHKHGEKHDILAQIPSLNEQQKLGTSQTRACMIAHMCAYKCEHFHVYVCVYENK
jgi:hypothetical protein